jgi:hypothetical protein
MQEEEEDEESVEVNALPQGSTLPQRCRACCRRNMQRRRVKKKAKKKILCESPHGAVRL